MMHVLLVLWESHYKTVFSGSMILTSVIVLKGKRGRENKNQGREKSAFAELGNGELIRCRVKRLLQAKGATGEKFHLPIPE